MLLDHVEVGQIVIQSDARVVDQYVEGADPALGQFGGELRIEDQAPAIERNVWQHPRHHLFVIRNAVRSPGVHDCMGVPRVIERHPGHYCGVEIGEIGKLFLVEGQIRAAANLALQEGRRRNDDIKSAIPRQHPGFQRLIGVEIRDADLDVREFFEGCNGVGRHIIRPDVQVENIFVIAVLAGMSISRRRIRAAATDH